MKEKRPCKNIVEKASNSFKPSFLNRLSEGRTKNVNLKVLGRMIFSYLISLYYSNRDISETMGSMINV